MTLISSRADAENLALTIVSEFAADPLGVWDIWEDPLKLGRWWGPPTFPATFTRHEFTVGGQSRYHMTGPAGETPRGWWRIDTIDKPHRIEFANGLAGEDGEPVPDITSMTECVVLERRESGTRMTVVTTFSDDDQMQQMLTRGMQEGMTQALSQIDELLLAD